MCPPATAVLLRLLSIGVNLDQFVQFVECNGNGRYRLSRGGCEQSTAGRFSGENHFDKGTLHGEQWYPYRAYQKVATDELGCTLFGRINEVKVHKMRWVGTAST